MLVKGLSRRVVTVRFPETGMFEQAIFLVREDGALRRGVTAEQVVSEACRIAQNHMIPPRRRSRRRLRPWLYAAAGGGLVGLVWLLTGLLL